MNIPYYKFIDGECNLLHSRNNLDELFMKMITNTITDEEYKEFIEQCLLKSDVAKNDMNNR